MENLKKVLSRDDTVLFIGSGVSMWSGIPSWSGVIYELGEFLENIGISAELVKAEARKGDLLQAASYGFDKLTPHQIGEFIRQVCRYGIAKPQEIHKKIVSLGPRCFVTTNYDDLIEQSLRLWRKDRFFAPPVTNKNLTETAAIVHARAIDFIFKPHGDAADSDSIILTREQYRQLLPQGERQAALESLKMLMASRPVVYIGFGLKDPDFLYLRDILFNIYRGGVLDHYAIMADVSVGEVDYWRRTYGIHLINFATIEKEDGTRDYSNIIALLDKLASTQKTDSFARFVPNSAESILALTRYASGLVRYPKIESEIPIRVHEAESRWGLQRKYWGNKFSRRLVNEFLEDGPKLAILVGLPGAGKSYSIRRAVAQISEKLVASCLSDNFDSANVVIPILVDLKLYRGNIRDLLSLALPTNLPLDDVLKNYKVRIFLDSFNEMPREFLENGAQETDFSRLVGSIKEASLLISSRTADGLDNLGISCYELDEIEPEIVKAEISRLEIFVEGRFEGEVLRLLQRPFYFRYIVEGKVKFSQEANPRDFYKLLFDNFEESFLSRFGHRINLQIPLSYVAYQSLNNGEEAFLLIDLLAELKIYLRSLKGNDLDCLEVANWLVSASMLIPQIGGRVAFVHQSITEYLAATELVRQYKNNPHILKDKLSLMRWDQAIFLGLSMLEDGQGEMFLADIFKADFLLAMNSIKYLEQGRDEVVLKLLDKIPDALRNGAIHESYRVGSSLEYNVPVSQVHVDALWKLVRIGGGVGGSAAVCLAKLCGDVVKDEFIGMFLQRKDDYSLCCNGLGRVLGDMITDADLKKIREIIDIEEQNSYDCDDDENVGFISGIAAALSRLDAKVVMDGLYPARKTEGIPLVASKILCDFLRDKHSSDALELAAELLLLGAEDAGTAIYFISTFGSKEKDLSWDCFSYDHIICLAKILDDEDRWSVRALKCICAARPDLSQCLAARSAEKSGVERAVIDYCIRPNDFSPIFSALHEFSKMDKDAQEKEPISILANINLDWAGQETLFVKLLKLKNKKIASVIFGGSSPPTVENLGNLDIGPIEWWLDWMVEAYSNSQDNYWFVNQLAGLFDEHLSQDDRNKFVVEFNRPDSKYREILLNLVLPNFSDFSTDQLSPDAISFLLAGLEDKRNFYYFRGDFLGNVATEEFIKERLLPLTVNAKGVFLDNLKNVLNKAGSRHRRRYIL